MTSQEIRRRRVVDIGTALHGPRFGVALAQGMGVSQPLVANVVAGRRNITDDFDRALAAHVDAVLADRLKALQSVARLRAAIGYDLGEKPGYTVSTDNVPAGEILAPEPEPDDGPNFGP